MKRFSMKTYLALALLLLAFGALWLLSPEWSRTNNGMVAIQGNTPGALTKAHQTGHTDPAKQIDIVIGLSLRNEKDLDSLLARQSDPASADFRKFISPDDFVQKYGPDQTDVDKVVLFMKNNGLSVVGIAPNHLLIQVRGTVKDIEQTFKLKINTYQVDGQDVYSNDRNPSVPAALKNTVTSVLGLNSITVFHSRMKHAPTTSAKKTTPTGYGPANLATAYNYPSASNAKQGVVYDGRGVTIAVASAYNYVQSDPEKYWQYYGIKRTGTVSQVYPNGQSSVNDGETTLDLEQVGALAPGADIIMYLGHDPGSSSFTLVFNQIVTDNIASVSTDSWGLCEGYTAQAEMDMDHRIFKEGAAQGISFFAAAGDDGAYDCKTKTPQLSIDYTASDTFVTSVGGTTLIVSNTDGSRLLEQAWTGAGGGISDIFDQPSWQVGPGVPNNKKRNTSDISLNADPDTGDSIYFNNSWDAAGGTSFASPELAALWADAVQANGGRLGHVGPTLYRIGQSSDYNTVFYDVTMGNNGADNGSAYPGYAAGTGWDHPTGWGSPDGRELIGWLIKDQAQSANPQGTPLSATKPLIVTPVPTPEKTRH